jgi:hypothetical protein
LVGCSAKTGVIPGLSNIPIDPSNSSWLFYFSFAHRFGPSPLQKIKDLRGPFLFPRYDCALKKTVMESHGWESRLDSQAGPKCIFMYFQSWRINLTSVSKTCIEYILDLHFDVRLFFAQCKFHLVKLIQGRLQGKCRYNQVTAVYGC